MNIKLKQNVIDLSKSLPTTLYVVGGYIRNFLIDESISKDIDLASNLSAGELKDSLGRFGFKVLAEYKRTGTVMFSDGEQKYEYTAFRKDSYNRGGKHAPNNVVFTDSILDDALRRDFKCNAVYYDISNGNIVDPLNGVGDIKNKILDTVKSPDEVFKSDGLRLMRLARFSAELGFNVKKQVIESAKRYADNIKDISVERVFEELNKILVADRKYSFSDRRGHYNGLKLLDETGVLDRVIPELTLGRNMAQRSDFHNYDVLEHTLKCLLYSNAKIRLYALLHDVGKPYQMVNTGKYHNHDKVGSKIAVEILTRLKADKKTCKRAELLIKYHMFDMNGEVREGKLKKFIVENFEYIEDLLLLKQADYSACKDDLSICKSVERWQKIIEKIKADGTPLTVKDLSVSAKDLQKLGYSGKEIGEELKKLFGIAIDNPKADLMKIAIKDKDLK